MTRVTVRGEEGKARVSRFGVDMVAPFSLCLFQVAPDIFRARVSVGLQLELCYGLG